MTQLKIGIIGAGATGLAAAWDFAGAGHRVTIYEAADRVGGLGGWLQRRQRGTGRWRSFIITGSPPTTASSPSPKRWVCATRSSFPARRPAIGSMVNRSAARFRPSAIFLPLSLVSTIRMGLAGMFIKLSPWWQPFERVTADEWIRRWMGREAYDKFFKTASDRQIRRAI